MTNQEKLRIENGIQCPECYGVKINNRYENKHSNNHIGWECQECGCNWSENKYK